MTDKRFASHDITVSFDDADAWPSCTVQVACTRCPATAKAEAGDGDPLYMALAALDEEPCAFVELDANGSPVPVSG